MHLDQKWLKHYLGNPCCNAFEILQLLLEKVD